MKTPRKLFIAMGVMFGFAAGAMAGDLPKQGTFKGNLYPLRNLQDD